MAAPSNPQAAALKLDRYVVIHVATTCDEHGVYVQKDSAETIEIAWILLDSKNCEEVRCRPLPHPWIRPMHTDCRMTAPPGQCSRQAREYAHHRPLQ